MRKRITPPKIVMPKIYESSGSVHSNLVRELLHAVALMNADPERLVNHAVAAAFEASRLHGEGWRAQRDRAPRERA